MAVNDPVWSEGELETFQSSGTTPTVRWFEGEMYVVHEYVEDSGGISIPNPFHRPFLGPIGGPI